MTSGAIRSGDRIDVVHRPAHGVTIALMFRAMVRDARLLPELLDAGDDLPAEARDTVASGTTFSLGA